jgi:hypothetical protein
MTGPNDLVVIGVKPADEEGAREGLLQPKYGGRQARRR